MKLLQILGIFVFLASSNAKVRFNLPLDILQDSENDAESIPDNSTNEKIFTSIDKQILAIVENKTKEVVGESSNTTSKEDSKEGTSAIASGGFNIPLNSTKDEEEKSKEETKPPPKVDDTLEEEGVSQKSGFSNYVNNINSLSSPMSNYIKQSGNLYNNMNNQNYLGRKLNPLLGSYVSVSKNTNIPLLMNLVNLASRNKHNSARRSTVNNLNTQIMGSIPNYQLMNLKQGWNGLNPMLNQLNLLSNQNSLTPNSIQFVIQGGLPSLLPTQNGLLGNNLGNNNLHSLTNEGFGTSNLQSLISGGNGNNIVPSNLQSFIGGGLDYTLGTSNLHPIIHGGISNNLVTSNLQSIIGGGHVNTLGTSNLQSRIGGGIGNNLGIGNIQSLIGGGLGNNFGTSNFQSHNGESIGNFLRTSNLQSLIGGRQNNSPSNLNSIINKMLDIRNPKPIMQSSLGVQQSLAMPNLNSLLSKSFVSNLHYGTGAGQNLALSNHNQLAQINPLANNGMLAALG